MKQKFSLVCFIVLLCVPFSAIRAQFIDDSLSSRLTQKNLAPEERVTTMTLLAKSKSATDTKNAIRIAENALVLCEQLKEPSVYKSFVYSVLHLQFMNNKMDEAQKAADGAVWFGYRTTNRRIKGIAWFRKGWMQEMTGEPREAEVTYLQALNFLEGTKAYSYESFVCYYLGAIMVHGTI